MKNNKKKKESLVWMFCCVGVKLTRIAKAVFRRPIRSLLELLLKPVDLVQVWWVLEICWKWWLKSQHSRSSRTQFQEENIINILLSETWIEFGCDWPLMIVLFPFTSFLRSNQSLIFSIVDAGRAVGGVDAESVIKNLFLVKTHFLGW